MRARRLTDTRERRRLARSLRQSWSRLREDPLASRKLGGAGLPNGRAALAGGLAWLGGSARASSPGAPVRGRANGGLNDGQGLVYVPRPSARGERDLW